MASLFETDICTVRWCQEKAGHSGPHKRPLYDSIGLSVETGRVSPFTVWLQGESARVSAVSFATLDPDVGLTWQAVDELVTVLRSALVKYKPREVA